MIELVLVGYVVISTFLLAKASAFLSDMTRELESSAQFKIVIAVLLLFAVYLWPLTLPIYFAIRPPPDWNKNAIRR